MYEDKVSDFSLEQHKIKLGEWGYIYNTNKELKAELPSQLSSRYQNYTPQTIAKKIKEKIAEEKYKSETINKLDIVKESLIQQFFSQFPGSEIITKDSYKLDK